MEVHRVAFVEGVDLSTIGNADVRVGQDELAEALHVFKSAGCVQCLIWLMKETYVVQSVAVNALAHTQHEVG